MPNLALYNGIVKQVKNQCFPFNLRENALSSLIIAKKRQYELIESLIAKADAKSDLEEERKNLTQSHQEHKADIKAYIAKLKEQKALLVQKQLAINAISLSQDEEEELEMILNKNERDEVDKPLIKRWLGRQKKDSPKMLKYNLLIEKKLLNESISSQQSLLKRDRAARKKTFLLLTEIKKLLTLPDYKQTLQAKQAELKVELTTWIKDQDPRNLQRVNDYKSFMTFVDQSKKHIVNYLPPMGGTSKSIEQEQQELVQTFNEAVRNLQDHVDTSEKAFSEIGIRFDDLPEEAKLLWQRAELAENLLEADFNPYLLPDVRAQALLKKLKTACPRKMVTVNGKQQLLVDVLAAELKAYVDENNKYKTALEADATPDNSKVKEHYQRLRNICEFGLYPLVMSLTNKRNWLEIRSIEEKVRAPWEEANVEIKAGMDKEGETIRLAIRDFYIAKKMSEKNKKNTPWQEEFEFAEEQVDRQRKAHGIAVDTLIERFPGIGRVNESIDLMSNEHEFRELTLQRDMLANKYRALLTLGSHVSMAFITKFDNAYNAMVEAKKTLTEAKPDPLNPELIKDAQKNLIQTIYEYMYLASVCEEVIRKNSPNFTKLKERSESKRTPVEEVAELKKGLDTWKIAEIIGAIHSGSEKLSGSRQAEYLLAQLQVVAAKLVADDIKKISESNLNQSLLGRFNGELNKSPVTLMEDISKKLKAAEESIAWKWFGRKTSYHAGLLHDLEMARALTLKAVTRYCTQRVAAGEALSSDLPALVNVSVTPVSKKVVGDSSVAASTPDSSVSDDEHAPLLPKSTSTSRSWSPIAKLKAWWKSRSVAKSTPAAKPADVASVAAPATATATATAKSVATSSGSSWWNRLFKKETKVNTPAVAATDPVANSAIPVSNPVAPAQQPSHPERFFTDKATTSLSVYQIEQETDVLPIAELDNFIKQSPEENSDSDPALASFTSKGNKAVKPGTFDTNHFQGHTLSIKNKEIKWVERIDSVTKSVVSEIWVVPEPMKLENIFKKCVRDIYLTSDKQAIDKDQLINQVLDICAKSLQEKMQAITKENIISTLNLHKDVVASLTQKSGSTYFTSSKIDKLATELVKVYKDTSEQSYGVPYLGKCKAGLDIVMRHSPCSLPSDTLLTLAIRELNSFMKAQEDPSNLKTLVITKSWDPAYIKAIMLCCELRNRYEKSHKLEYVNATGYPITSVTDAEITALEWRLAETTGAKHDLGVLGKKLAEQKEITSPLSQLGEEFPKNILRLSA